MTTETDPEWIAALRPAQPAPAPLPPVALHDPLEERRRALAVAWEQIGREFLDLLSITVPIFIGVYLALLLSRRQP